MRVEEGEGGCPEGPVSRPVREQQLCGQRGGQREGTGGGARAWPTTHAPTSLAVRALAFPHLRGPSPTAASIPRTLLCSGPVLSRGGLSLQHVGQRSTPSLEHQPSSLIMFRSRLQGPLSPGLLLPIWLLLLPFLPTSKRWWAPEVGPQTASLSRFRFLYFWYHGPFVSLPTSSF